MTREQTVNRIEELEAQMRELEPKIKKVPSILRMAIPGGVAIFGLFSLFTTFLVFAAEYEFDETQVGTIVTMIVFGAIFLLGVVLCLLGIPQLKRMIGINREYNKLDDEKKSLEKRLKLLAKTDLAESNDDTLLRLLSENKITLEEYKSLSKKGK